MGEIQNKIEFLVNNFSEGDFIFDLLFIYGNTKTTIKRLRDSDKNKLTDKGELELRNKLFFKVVDDNLYATIDERKNKLKGKRTDPLFIIVTNYDDFLAYDTKTKDTLDIKLSELGKKYDFFLPWSGIEKQKYQDENIADVKAAQDLAKLYDEITKTNPHRTEAEVHDLNIFLSRLLFCYFAEDTNIFEKNQFTNAIGSHTNESGEDVKDLLEKIFQTFNQTKEKRDGHLSDYLNDFPYVNGRLFADEYSIPSFTEKSRKILLNMGSLDWSQINPDIFGSMMQAVVTSDDRSSFGMHYTSVPNIMKLIKPLFLDELREEFENSIGNDKKLQSLKLRLSKIKFFDPACGSGNFLIIAYKEVKALEIDIIKEMGTLALSDIKLSQFYGIEIDNFACETARLSLYLAEHQMNVLFLEEIGLQVEPLPLKDGGNIVQGNATRIDWVEVCPKEENDEIYILGNPPYRGYGKQTLEQKEDMIHVFLGVDNFKKMDYISCWFYKGAQYIENTNSVCALVSTNSIGQGEQVGLLWPNIFKFNLEITFAYQSFKWKNNAKDKAGVTVVIVGIKNVTSDKKYIYSNSIKYEVKNINPYLVEGDNIFVYGIKKSLSDLPEMIIGSKASDDGNLILTVDEKDDLINKYPESVPLLKKYIGADDFLNNKTRYCLLIYEENVDLAFSIPPLKERFIKCKEFREKSKKESTQKLALKPYAFDEQKYQELDSIIVPQTTSENREYIPIGFFNSEYVISNGVRLIYNVHSWMFGLLSSKLHNVWVQKVAGRLETRIQYSNTICYNTFPFPKITEKQKEEIAEFVYEILDERAKHSEKTLKEMYNPDKMPEGLKHAHHQLDLAIEKIYRPKPFEDDEERLEYLFKLYEKMIAKEKEEIINNKKK